MQRSQQDFSFLSKEIALSGSEGTTDQTTRRGSPTAQRAGNAPRQVAHTQACLLLCRDFVTLARTAGSDLDLGGGVAVVATVLFNLVADIHASQDLAEDDVAAVKVGCQRRGDEELRAVGAGARISHGEEVLLLVSVLEVLV